MTHDLAIDDNPTLKSRLNVSYHSLFRAPLMSDQPNWFFRCWQSLFGSVNPDSDRLPYLRSLAAWYWFAAFCFGLVVILNMVGSGAAVAVLWALASTAAMAVVGFLFGIPKTSQVGAPGRIVPPAKSGSGTGLVTPTPTPDTGDKRTRHFVNTNLEDISDWLTKAMVGVAVVEWRPILDAIDRGATTLAAGITVGTGSGNPPDGAALAAAYATMIYFGAAGFIFGYNYTRLFLTEVYRLADRSIEDRLDGIEGELKGLQSSDPKTTPAADGGGK